MKTFSRGKSQKLLFRMALRCRVVGFNPKSVTWKDLEEAFASFGPVTVSKKRNDNRAFVTFFSVKDGFRAVDQRYISYKDYK